MSKLLIIAQKVDQNDDLLGFFVDWIGEFAKHFESVHVITLAKGSYMLPSNVFVHSLGKEIGRTKLLQLAKFYVLLFKFTPKTDGIFAHMSPIFAIAAWPVAAIYRKRVVLWYLHRSLTLKLKIANLLCYGIVTAAKESLRLHSNKIIEVGHGIDVQRFRVERNWEKIAQEPPHLLSVGRISEIKNYPTLVRAIKILKEKLPDIKLQIIGRPVMKPDLKTLESLKQLIGESRLEANIELVGFVPYSEIKPYYEQNWINVNLTPPGGIDKAVLEGMASGQLTLTSNTAFTKYFGQWSSTLVFEHGHDRNLAEVIARIIVTLPKDKENISLFLNQVVENQHSLNKMVTKIVRILST